MPAAPLLGAISLGLDAANSVTRTINHRARYGSGKTTSVNETLDLSEDTDVGLETDTEDEQSDAGIAYVFDAAVCPISSIMILYSSVYADCLVSMLLAQASHHIC